MEGKTINLFKVFRQYSIGFYGYTTEQALEDARRAVRRFIPAKNDRRAEYQLAKLCGIANSLDLVLCADIYLHAKDVCKGENVWELIKLQKKLNDIITEFYHSTSTLFWHNPIASVMNDRRYIR